MVGFPKTAPLGINNRATDTTADQVKEGKRGECEYLRMSNRVPLTAKGLGSNETESGRLVGAGSPHAELHPPVFLLGLPWWVIYINEEH